jgi:type I restriction enzyme M protein
MSNNNSDFKQTLWKAADKLRDQMDPAEYKHIVLGLIFLKYISDSFSAQKEKIKEMVTNPDSDFFINEDITGINDKDLEDRDYFTKDNVFWVPESARWETLRDQAKQSDIDIIVDAAMGAIESENKPLKGMLNKSYGKSELAAGRLGKLIDLISTIGFSNEQNAGDILGEVYEYFLGQFATAEGKKGGQFYTTRCIVKTLVEILSPHKGRVYDPCCGSGGMFVQSEEFIKSHGGNRNDISIYGQESNRTTWRLSAMNLAIRGIAADLGKEHADTFANDQHPDVRFDYILANPPFNISDWDGENYDNDPRWVYGRPPVGNANYAWLQHMLWKLRPGGQAGVVLANGSMNSNTSGEGEIREAMIKGDVVEVMIALPGNLFLNTTIPVCLWFLTNDKTANGRNRTNETLFIDARNLGTMETRVLKVLTDADIQKVQDTVSSWRSGDGYEDVEGFCKSSTTEEIEENDYVLTPARYVGFADEEDDGIPFEEKIKKLTKEYLEISDESLALEKVLKNNLTRLNDD